MIQQKNLYAICMRAGVRASWGSVIMSNKKLCGAKTRKGLPCKRKALLNGRCPNHGGLSTGPKTIKGKRRALANLIQNK